MTRRNNIPQRTPIFLGCEGESERGYGALLNRLVREMPDFHLHIHVELLQPGAGDPLALMQRATQKIADLERRRERFALKAVLLDFGVANKNLAAQQMAHEKGIDHIIWQDPDHEAFLLRHLDNCQQLRPPPGASMAALRQHWPDYAKARAQVQLARRITMENIIRASVVEPDLKAFLTALGIIENAAEI